MEPLHWYLLVLFALFVVMVVTAMPYEATANRLLYKLTNRLPCRIIHEGRRPYLERYYLGSIFGVTFYLHRFVASDPADALHNHPWPGVGIILAGGYYEHRFVRAHPQSVHTTVEWRKRWSVAKLKPSTFHRVEVLPNQHAWSLFAHTGKVQSWGMIDLSNGVYRIYNYDRADTDPGAPITVQHRWGWWTYSPMGKMRRATGEACALIGPPHPFQLRLMECNDADRAKLWDIYQRAMAETKS